MSIPGSWHHAYLIALAICIPLGVLVVALEKPLKRRLAKRRLRKMRLVGYGRLDPWCAAIVKPRRFYVHHWNAATGRAYRA